MSQPFIGEITMFGGNFAPAGWALCDGQLLQISQFTALFSIFGTTYGGDGRISFGLPDLRGRIPLHEGEGLGLSSRNLGSKAGVETVTLNTSQLGAHTHALRASQNASSNATSIVGAVTGNAGGAALYGEPPNPTALDASAVSSTGNGQSHPNLAPYQVVNFIVALIGTFPSRS